jgi:2-amino-4-hydroxy-6-hydroxymethyldihydropteridine diphosphokinase
MKSLHAVVLSVGTNQGNRKQNILNCFQCIQSQIGGVVQYSQIYETPAWGFESDPFYNAAVYLQTESSPNQLLKNIQQIENELGRVRLVNATTYQARIIDIDIIFYDEIEINQAHLQLPHPHFQHRKFVLEPMAEFNLNWKHPKLDKTIVELLDSCTDISTCNPVIF